jgi:DNA polymerase-3 subunit epsilon
MRPATSWARWCSHLGLPQRTGRAHRALADAEMAAALLARMQHDLRTRWRVAEPSHALLQTLQRCARPAVGALLARHAE